jgi:hypothetical protein
VTRVDPEDQWLLDEYNWFPNTQGYLCTNLDSITVRLHHCIMGQPINKFTVIDHIDRDRQNNSRSNLRYATRSENYLNSEYSDRAAYIYPQASGSWYVEITRTPNRYYGGTYKTYEEAIEARDALLRKLGEL